MNQLLYVFTHSPSTISAQEGFDALLMGSAFASCSALFLDDAVFQLLPDQRAEAQGRKNFPLGFGALGDYGVSAVYARQKSVEHRRLDASRFIFDVEQLNDEQINRLIADHQRVLSF